MVLRENLDLQELLGRTDIPKDAKEIITSNFSKIKKLESELEDRTLHPQYYYIFNSVTNPIQVIDRKLRFVLFNRAFRNWSHEHGLETQVIGKTMAKVFPFLDKEAIDDYKQIFQTGTSSIIEKQERVFNDRTEYYNVQKIPIFKNDKRGSLVTHVATIIRDITEDVKSQDALLETITNFRLLFEETPIPIREMDFSEVKTYLDQKRRDGINDFEAYLNNNPEEVKLLAKLVKTVRLNKANLQLFESINKDEWVNYLTKMYEGQTEDITDQLHAFKTDLLAFISGQNIIERDPIVYSIKGRKIHSLMKAYVVPGFEETLSKIFVSNVDITELKKTEENLKESEERFRSLFEDAPYPLMEFDLSEIWKYLNQLKLRNKKELEKFIDNNPSELSKLLPMVKLIHINEASLNLYELEDKDDFQLTNFGVFKRGLVELFFGTKRYDGEAIFKTSKGNEVHSLYSVSSVQSIEDSDDNPLSRVFFSVIDLSKLKEAEKELIRSEEKLRNIVENSTDGIVLIDEKRSIIEWNAGMERLTKIPSKTALNHQFWDVFSPLLPGHLRTSRSIDLILSRLNNGLMTGKAQWFARPIESELLIHSEYKFVQTNIFPIQTQKGFMLGSIWRDITQAKQLEAKIRKEVVKFHIEDGILYLLQEAEPLLSREAFKDLLQISYHGLIVSRTPETDYRQILEEEYKFIWLAESALTGPDVSHASIFEKIVYHLEQLPPNSVVLIDRLDYLISKNGFQETMNFIYKIRELAIFLGFTAILSIDPKILSNNHLEVLEKETQPLVMRSLSKIPEELLEILRFVKSQNNMGKRPSITNLTNELEISRPTARKRVNRLTSTGLLRENPIGRTKLLELTQKGLNVFLRK